MICPFCEAELKELRECGTQVGLYCPNACKTKLAMDPEIWHALTDGKKAQDALDKIFEIKCEVEGCCLEIQEGLLRQLVKSKDPDIIEQIDLEVSTIDTLMTALEEILNEYDMF